MKDGQKLKLGDAPVVTPRNIQEVQASKLGDAQGIPTSSTKAPGHFSMRYIFIASCIMCYSWSVFIFCCVFGFSIKLDPIIPLFWRETRSTCSALGFSCYLFLRVVSNKLIGVGRVEEILRVFRDANGSLLGLWHRLLHVMLDVIIIICLVYIVVA